MHLNSMDKSGGVYYGMPSELSAISMPIINVMPTMLPQYLQYWRIRQSYTSLYGESDHGYLNHSLPAKDSELTTAVRLVPVEIDLEGHSVDPNGRMKGGASGSVLSSTAIMVSNRYMSSLRRSNKFISGDGLRIELHSGHSVTDSKDRGKSSRRLWPNSGACIAT